MKELIQRGIVVDRQVNELWSGLTARLNLRRQLVLPRFGKCLLRLMVAPQPPQRRALRRPCLVILGCDLQGSVSRGQRLLPFAEPGPDATLISPYLSILGRTLDRAGGETVRYAQQHMPDQPTRGAGKTKRGLAPSRPGQFPKRVHRHLARTLDHEVYPHGRGGRWGTDVEYGRIMELTRNRKRRRPWMSLTNRAMRLRWKQLLGGPL